MSADEKQSQPVSRTEWVLAALSALAVLVLVGYLLVEQLGQKPGPPVVTVEVVSIDKVEGGYQVRYRAKNQGGSTATGLDLEGVLTRPGHPEERVTVSLDFLPAHGARQGGFFFRSDPRAGELELHALGYVDP